MRKRRKQENRREDEEREKNPEERRSSCADNLVPTLKTNTVDLQGFAVAAANPVCGPYPYLAGSPEMNQGAYGAHWA